MGEKEEGEKGGGEEERKEGEEGEKGGGATSTFCLFLQCPHVIEH